jgi:hypothetical protein
MELLPEKFTMFGKISFQAEPVIALNDAGTAKVKVSTQYVGVTSLVKFVFLFKEGG